VVNLPIGLLALVLTFRLKRHAHAGGEWKFDAPGLVLFILFVAPILLALQQVQRLSTGSLLLVGALLALGVVSLLLLLWREQRALSPLLPVSLLRHPAIWRSDALAACHGAALVSLITFLPIYLQVVRGADPSEVGLLLLPLTVGIAIGSVTTGRLISRTGRTAIFPSIGQGIVGCGWIFLALFGGRIPLYWLPAAFIVISFATGSTMPVVQLTVQIAAGPKNLGAASASVQFMRSIGAALGTATIGAVLFAVLAAQDPRIASLFADVV